MPDERSPKKKPSGRRAGKSARRSSPPGVPKIRATGVSRPMPAPVRAQTTTPDETEVERRERYMSLGEHLEEFRRRLIAIVLVLLLAGIVAGIFVYQIHDLLIQPYLALVGAVPGKNVTLILRQVPGPLVSLMKLAVMVGLTVTMPICVSILWGFVRPAVSRRAAWTGQITVLASSCLFWLGIFVCWRFIFPVALQFMLIDLLPSGVSPQLALEDYYSFVFFLHIGAGLGFQLPLLIVILGALGILSFAWHRNSWGSVTVGIFIFAALITPPDPVTQLAMAIPLLILYVLSISIVWLIERSRRRPQAD